MATENENVTATATPAPKKAPDARKMSLYIPEALRSEVEAQAARLDRSVSWSVARLIKSGLPTLRELSSQSDDE